MAQTFHLTATDHTDYSYAIQQGSTFDSVTFLHPDNLTTWNARGQIRDNYADLGGVIKATFTFPTLVYEPVTIGTVTKSYTKIKPTLSAAVTQALVFDLKKRIDSTVTAVPGKNVWVYDVEVYSSDVVPVVYRIGEGFVEISKEVTR